MFDYYEYEEKLKKLIKESFRKEDDKLLVRSVHYQGSDSNLAATAYTFEVVLIGENELMKGDKDK